ncbi:putative zinc metalloprotease [Gottschalkia purinilytica]|uniref:Zinc metalloprotease n=1 Tax=Gottschalkia purinilytica TaxID=1503 RepID=A0A0L0WBI1_GOTPU|nr:RIP metalloprotease RseP [Gottschalkia purinilytica]KNF08853.1 putative zinc metalloprotease [Gottschalkia purinilytica]
MQTALAAIFVFCLIIVVHELGHFVVAKLTGVRVHEFAIGMGPKIFGIKKGETVYTLRILPIGGYVKMEGEDEDSEDEKSFGKKSIGARIAIISAGAIMNFILAIIVFTIYAYSMGVPTTTIKSVENNLPAQQAGIKKDDKIININDKKVEKWEDIKTIIGESKGKEANVTVLRDNKKLNFKIKPIVDEKDKRLIIGITPTTEKSFIGALKSGVENVIFVLGMMIQFIAKLFQGNIGSNDISGPVGIVYAVGEVAKSGWLSVLYLAGFISINLGFFNLLPIPALDGGRLVFLFIELLRGKPINPEKEGFVHFIGLVLLLALGVFVAYKDLIRFDIL